MKVPDVTTLVNQVSTLLRAVRDDFPGAALDTSAWEVVSLGSGHSISITGSELRVASGVTANSETIIRSKFSFTVPFRVWFIGRLSQRIVNQEFYLEVANKAGDMVAQWMFDGANATQGKYGTINSGDANLSAASSISSTASDTIFEIQLFPDEGWFSQRGVDSTGGKSYAYVRSKNVPDPNEEYYLRIRVKNLSTPPASTTTLTLGAVAAQDINELTAEITGGQGDAGAGAAKALTMYLVGGYASLNATNGTGGISGYKLLAAAGTNAAVVKSSGGRVFGWSFGNPSAAWRYVKIYNKATAPTVGTDSPVLTLALPPGGQVTVMNDIGHYLSNGIGIATTTGYADADTGAVTAGDVIGALFYA